MNVNPLRAQPRDVAQHRAILSRIQPARHSRSATRPLLACAIAAAMACSARADEFWAGTNGNWDASLWSTTPGGPPTLPPPTTGNASITVNDALTRTVTFSQTGPGPSLGTLTIDSTGGGLSVLTQTQGTMTASSLLLGATGRGEYDLYAGSLSAGGATITGGTFNQTGGTASFGSLSLGDDTGRAGTYSMGAGGAALHVTNGLTVAAGSFNQGGGSVRAAYLNLGDQYKLANNYSIGAGGVLNVDGMIELGNTTYTQTGGTVTATRFSDDYELFSTAPTITMSGGTLIAPGVSQLNTSDMTGRPATMIHTGGTFHVGGLLIVSYNLSGSGSLIVDGAMDAEDQFTQSGGTANIGGQLLIAGHGMNVSGGALNVAGPLQLNGQPFSDSPIPTYVQSGGTVRAASLQFPGSASSGFQGTASYVLTGGTLTATNATSFVGPNGPHASAAFLQSGGTFTASVLEVLGETDIAALPSSYSLSGGSLQVTGNLTVRDSNYSQAGGVATIGGTLSVERNLSSTTVSRITTLNGGTLNAGALNNNSNFILSGGTLNTGQILNTGSFTYSGGTMNAAFVNGVSPTYIPFTAPVLSLAGLSVKIPSLVNNGVVRADEALALFTGAATNNAAYLSVSSFNTFVTLTNGPAAYLQGGTIDRFRLTGDLLSSSTNSANWKTASSTLEFLPGGTTNAHTLSFTGADEGGDTLNGYANNFAWGTLELDAGQSLTLQDGNADPGGALYADAVSLADGLSQINAITGNGLDIYYNASNPLNAYLGGQTYPLTDGGFLIAAVPEPSALGGMLIVGAAAGLRRRRRRCGA